MSLVEQTLSTLGSEKDYQNDWDSEKTWQKWPIFGRKFGPVYIKFLGNSEKSKSLHTMLQNRQKQVGAAGAPGAAGLATLE